MAEPQASVLSEPATVTIAGSETINVLNTSNDRTGCFISASIWDLSSDLLNALGAMGLLGCLIWISRKKRE